MKTLYDVIKEMSVTELAEFLAENDTQIVRRADTLICNRCKKNNPHPQCQDKDNACDYLTWSNADSVRVWLMQEVADGT